MLDVAFVIRTKNEEKYLQKVLSEIKRQANEENLSFSIVIVDSGSSDSTIEIAKRNDCQIFNIPAQQFTFGKSLNLGVSNVICEIVVVVSGHCVPLNGWLKNLIAPIKNSEAQLTYGGHLPDPLSRCSEYNHFFEVYIEMFASRDVSYFNNGNAAFLRKTWLIHKFDEFARVQEDALFALWHAKNGAQIVFVPTSNVIHHHNYKNADLFIRFYKDYAYNLKNKIRTKAFNRIFKKFINGLINDFKLAISRRKLWRALPGIISYRIILFFIQLITRVIYGYKNLSSNLQ